MTTRDQNIAAPGAAADQAPPRPRLAMLSLTALGIVFGDIGTSPLYALRQCFQGTHAVTYSAANVLGVVSLIFWALIVVISIKYLLFVLRADNRGEGGIVALVALLNPRRATPGSYRHVLILLGIFGAALLYGDGTITPAISVLSAVEGLNIATPFFEPYIGSVTIAILLVLFAVQRHGTARIGAIFGPVMLVWFVVLAVLGIGGIVRAPAILAAVNPAHGAAFFAANGFTGFLVLGTVFLVVTGGEALYADMGHVGRLPIRFAWFALVLPALVLNYFGQGALILSDPQQIAQPFYHLAPAWALYPLVLIATLATIIASQAVISGAFSVTRQAVQLGLLPHLKIVQTHGEESGQVYIPTINWLLMIATVGLVLGFRSSGNLASAYGLAVSMDMVITTVLIAYVAYRWHWNPLLIIGLAIAFFAVDVAFLGANLFKIADGGWYPLLVAGLVFTLMSTWQRGCERIAEKLQVGREPLEVFLERLAADPPHRVPGTAVFMLADSHQVPLVLVHQLESLQVLHEQVLLMTIEIGEVPRVPTAERLEIERLTHGFVRVIARYGFMQSPNVPVILRLCESAGVDVDIDKSTFFLGRETLIPSATLPGITRWRDKLFGLMARNARHPTAYFRIPPERVLELGIQVES